MSQTCQKHYKTNEKQCKHVSQKYVFGSVVLNIVVIPLTPIRLLLAEGVKHIKELLKKYKTKTPLLQTGSGQILSEQDSIMIRKCKL